MPVLRERRVARLRKTGGSRSVTIPLAWLHEMRVSDRVEITFTGKNIIIEPPGEASTLEDRPEFSLFLDFLTRDSLLHPESLVNAATFMAGDDELFTGVETGDLVDEADEE